MSQSSKNVYTHDNIWNRMGAAMRFATILPLIAGYVEVAGAIVAADAVLGTVSGWVRPRLYTAKYQRANTLWGLGWLAVGLWMMSGKVPFAVGVLVGIWSALISLSWWATRKMRTNSDTSLRLWSKGYLRDEAVDLHSVFQDHQS